MRTFGAMLGPPHSLGGRLTPLWATDSTYLLRLLCSPCSHGTEGTPRLLLTAPREQARAPPTSRPVGEGGVATLSTLPPQPCQGLEPGSSTVLSLRGLGPLACLG